MQSFFEWFSSTPARQRPWLILGKGPSFDRRRDYDLARFHLLSLNHVVRELRVELAHALDIDVVQACGDAILANAGALVMPWFPHVGNRAGPDDLAAWVTRLPALRQLDTEGRLLWYDCSTAPTRHGPGPVVQATWFSAEAALSALALAGASQVRSLGVDGGVAYGGAFADLSGVTRLNAGHPNFDLQFAEFANIIRRTGVDYAPLDVEAPIRVFVGSEEPQMLAVKVLAYSIRRHASMTTRIVPLHECKVDYPLPKDPPNRPRTPFSFHRFAIPALVQRRGRALYLDSDMLVFGDLRSLWTLPMNGAQVLAAAEPGGSGRRPQFSVMLLDCAALDWDVRAIIGQLDAGALSYESLMFDLAVARNVAPAISPHWNSLERYEPGTTQLLHYTDMHRQPWRAHGNPLGHLWVRTLREAIGEGAITMAEVEEHAQRGWVLPSLPEQLRRGIDEARWLPRQLARLEAQLRRVTRNLRDPATVVRKLTARAARLWRGPRA